MNYHVLSNGDMILFPKVAVIFGIILMYIFSKLGQRDADSKVKKKRVITKIVPWIVLCIFLSELSLLVYRYMNYPWDIEPEPSYSSIFRENNYIATGYTIWGWANDYQLPIISNLTGCIMWFCWTVYAFNFKPSCTSWWKKVCKFFAYFILSAVILGFYIHNLSDIWIYVGVIIFVSILLWIAKVRPNKMIKSETVEDTTVKEKAIVEDKLTNTEDPSRFMPKTAEELNPQIELQDFPVIETDFVESESKENMAKQISQNVNELDNKIFSSSKIIVKNPTNMEMIYCKYCGKRIEADSMFCKYCGKKFQN